MNHFSLRIPSSLNPLQIAESFSSCSHHDTARDAGRDQDGGGGGGTQAAIRTGADSHLRVHRTSRRIEAPSPALHLVEVETFEGLFK